MKYITYLACLFLSTQVFSQKTETFYDYNWKPCKPPEARFYSILEKTDSGWLRQDYFVATNQLQMKGLFIDSACKINNGLTSYFYPNGQVSSINNWTNGKKEGLYIGYYTDGNHRDSATYDKDLVVGYALGWYESGNVSDSTVNVNDSLYKYYGWFDNGKFLIPALIYMTN